MYPYHGFCAETKYARFGMGERFTWRGLDRGVLGAPRKADSSGFTGRAPREEEDAQGPREEENHIYEAVCECHDDRGQEEG